MVYRQVQKCETPSMVFIGIVNMLYGHMVKQSHLSLKFAGHIFVYYLTCKG